MSKIANKWRDYAGGQLLDRAAHRTVLLVWMSCLFLLCGADIGLVTAVQAQEQANTGPNPALSGIEKRLATVDQNKPMLLQADELIYDNRRKRVVARGNVEIYYNNYSLTADSIIYDRARNLLMAKGNVRIKEPDGAVITADEFTLTQDFRDGFINSLRVVTSDDLRIAAARARRIKGNKTIFENAVATPCKPCAEHPEKPVSWQIKAVRVIHDKNEKTVTYEGASLELFGVPIAYVPYFSHPDPSVKRRSGFLMPKISQSTDLGTMVETPYYFALAPTFDFTFSPVTTTKQGVLLKGTWRHRLATGAYKIDMAGIRQLDPTNDNNPATTLPSERKFRGSVKTQGEFSINQMFRWGWDATVSSDDTFRRFYKLDNIRQTERISQAYLIGEGRRNYLAARAYQFGGLVAGDTSDTNISVHPVIDYNYIFGDPVLGGELSFNSNILSLSRTADGTDSNRFISDVQWRKTLIDPLGQTFTPFFGARGDVYYMSNVVDSVTAQKTYSGTKTRGVLTGGLDYRYPFIAHTDNASHTFEPIAQIIFRNNVANQNKVANEDAQSLVLDDTLLFDIDKFSGYDRVETGTRVNYGLQYAIQFFNGGYFRTVLGQSAHVAGTNPFPTASGLDTARSDYVAGVYLAPNKHLRLFSQARFSQKTMALLRNDSYLQFNYGPLALAVNYGLQQPVPGIGITTKREEIQGAGSLRFVENWYGFGSIRYDLVSNSVMSDSVGVKYADECLLVSVSYNQTFYRDQDITTNQSVVLRLELKHLGGVDIKSDGFSGTQ